MRPSRVLDLTDFQGSVRSTRGGISVEEQRVPLEEVAVILLGNRTTISGGALEMLAKYEVVLLNCSWNSVPNYVGYTWSSNSRVASRHRAQAEASSAKRNRAWKEIIEAKIDGQRANLLGAHEAAVTRLTVLRDTVKVGDSQNNEAIAAKVYWDALFQQNEFTRTRENTDSLNAMLNYGYTVLRGFSIQAVSAAGLWPSYGLWHRNRSNPFVLADDFIEPFRPAVDHEVALIGDGGSLEDPEVKRALVNVTKNQFNSEPSTTLTQMHNTASRLAQYLEGERTSVNVPSWEPTV